MEKKFTQGEWKSRGFENNSNGFINIDFQDGFISVYGGCTYNLTEDKKQLFIEKAEANAKLIAADPDLLNALEECISELYLIHLQYGDKQNAKDHCPVLIKAEHAIKKALE